jgi:hypothetical protein
MAALTLVMQGTTESQLRLDSEIVALTAVMQNVTEALADDHGLRAMVVDHERRLRRIEGTRG